MLRHACRFQMVMSIECEVISCRQRHFHISLLVWHAARLDVTIFSRIHKVFSARHSALSSGFVKSITHPLSDCKGMLPSRDSTSRITIAVQIWCVNRYPISGSLTAAIWPLVWSEPREGGASIGWTQRGAVQCKAKLLSWCSL